MAHVGEAGSSRGTLLPFCGKYEGRNNLRFVIITALLPVGLLVVTTTLQPAAPGEEPVWRAPQTKNEAFRAFLL